MPSLIGVGAGLCSSGVGEDGGGVVEALGSDILTGEVLSPVKLSLPLESLFARRV